MTDNINANTLNTIPDIEQYWDIQLNNGQLPSIVSLKSQEKVWIHCPVCKEPVQRRAVDIWKADKKGVMQIRCCRACSKITPQNALMVLFPEITQYWCFDKNKRIPEGYAISSGKKVYIRCPDCGTERYLAVCDAVVKDADGKYRVSSCNDCAKAKTLDLKRQSDSNIAKACPDIDLYWDDKNEHRPDELTLHTLTKIYTHCPTCGKLLHRRATNTFKEENGVWKVLQCQKCAATDANREKGLRYSGALILECPEIKDWWDTEKNNKPLGDISRGSHYEAYWHCPACRGSFQKDVHTFVSVHQDGKLGPVACPHCGYSGDPEDNLVKVCPEIEQWWDYDANAPFRPEQFSRGAQFQADLVCPDCGLRLHTGIHSLLHVDEEGNVVISHKGRCRKYKAMASENNLVTCHPQVKKWWDYDKNAPAIPEEYTLFSPKRAYFKCPDCGTETYRRISDAFLKADTTGKPTLFVCPYCSERGVDPEVNSLKAMNPELAAEWSPTNEWPPNKVRAISSRIAIWRCPTCHGEYNARIKDREVGDDSCPYCKGIKPLPGYNTFATKHPQLIKQEWAFNENTLIGADPDKILDTNVQKAWWKCPSCQHLYLMSAKDRLMKEKRRHNPCTFCGGRRLPSPRVIL